MTARPSSGKEPTGGISGNQFLRCVKVIVRPSSGRPGYLPSDLYKLRYEQQSPKRFPIRQLLESIG